MDYISLDHLAERPGARELAQVATAQHLPIVDFALMDASLRGGDRSAWTPEQVAGADRVLERITEAMVEAESIVNGYLRRRGYDLPLSPVPSLVTGWVRDIGRYLLHKDRISDESKDPIARNYRDAKKFLEQVVNGTFSLGADDPIATNPAQADVRFDADENVFSRQQLRSFR
ncbi:hypothetical protein WP8S17C03_22780 [Metapseudomonas otitidis]|uniref:Mu-like prophage protein gp36 n=1 Tax=Metapseudomonas otitidis TaxID=319939 RepID=A0A6S5RV79_9GAMM|nr:DUF1320 domain-containing protein [Pseudomonas otitidis]BBT16229.1 hypothetical protein WP8S17C03_22780 [Pseudomonas otitidis]